MSEIDIEGATEALAADLDMQDEPDLSEAGLVEDNQVEPESFTGFDPNNLPEDMQAVYRSMQGDYTRKTQELAEMRRNYESLSEIGVDPSEAANIVSLWQELNTDPEVAARFASALQDRLEELGYLEQPTTQDYTPDNVSYDGLPPDVARELEEMRNFRDQFYETQQQQEIMSELEYQENTIRTMNPNYGDPDIEAIYNLAYATDGDLMAAAEQYHSIQQHLLGRYLESKSVPHGATPAPSGPNMVPGKEFGSLDDAHKAAMEAIRNIS